MLHDVISASNVVADETDVYFVQNREDNGPSAVLYKVPLDANDITLTDANIWNLLPIRDGERYWAIDLFCRNPDCTCSSSVINFYRLDYGEPRLTGEVIGHRDRCRRAGSFQRATASSSLMFDSASSTTCGPTSAYPTSC